MQTSLSILGLGAFGRFMAQHLRAHFHILAHDARNIEHDAVQLGIRAASLPEAAQSPIIILALPAQHLEPALIAIRDQIQPDALVLDVCSVKLRPLALMQKYLPQSVRIIGTHPLFGPQSGKDGIAGLPVALCPARADEKTISCVRTFLADDLKLRVVDVSPDQHDRQMAHVQALTHLLSRALSQLDLPETDLATIAYQQLLAMRANLRHDSDDLFDTIQKENPYASAARAALRGKLAELEQRLR